MSKAPTLRKITVERVSIVKTFDTPHFLKTTPLFYQPLPFDGKNLTRTLFGEYYENSTPPSPL